VHRRWTVILAQGSYALNTTSGWFWPNRDMSQIDPKATVANGRFPEI